VGSAVPQDLSEERSFLECPKNLRQHILCTQQHVIVPEAQHAIALSLQYLGTMLVVRERIEMLPAIQLDHQSRRHADEINDVASQQVLPPELVPGQLLPAQEVPQAPLGIGAVAVQVAGANPFELHRGSFTW
jgi:hypothetical protein